MLSLVVVAVVVELDQHMSAGGGGGGAVKHQNCYWCNTVGMDQIL